MTNDESTAGTRRLVRVDFGRYPDEIDCIECGGTADYEGANHGTWACRECGVTYPLEEAKRQMRTETE